MIQIEKFAPNPVANSGEFLDHHTSGLSTGSRDRAGCDRMKVREIIELMEANGWYLVATRGSHRQYRHPQKTGRVTIAGKPSHDLKPGTLNSILKQAGLKESP